MWEGFWRIEQGKRTGQRLSARELPNLPGCRDERIRKRKNMKRRKQIAIWLTIAALAAGMVSGCGKKVGETDPGSEPENSEEAVEAPATAEELLGRAKDTLQAAASIKGNLFMNMVMDYKAQGVEATLECKMEQTIEQLREPEAVHMRGTVDINLAGITVDTETYAVKEDGKYVTYTGSGGQWIKETAGQTGSQGDVTETIDLLLKNPGALTVEPADGEGLYQVGGTITGENLSGIMSTVGTLLEEDTDVYNGLEAKATLVIDRVTGLPTEISMDFTDSYNALMQANREDQGFDEVTIKEFSVSISGYELDTVSEITVPDEVRQSALDMDALETLPDETAEETRDPEEPESRDYTIHQNEKGEYVLGTNWDDNTAGISCPDGFVYDDSSDKTWLRFNWSEHDDVHGLSLTYTLYTIDDNYGEEDLAQSQESSYAYMQTSGDYAEVSFDGVQTVTAAGKTVSYTKLSYIYMGTYYTEEYNSWTVLPDGRMIQCTVKEESYEEPCRLIDTGSIFDTAFAALAE